jgi:hypothetical protein
MFRLCCAPLKRSVKAEKGQLQILHGVDRALHDQLVQDDNR